MQQDQNPSSLRPISPDRRLRVVEVREVLSLTPHMRRITFASAALMDFPVRRPAQWVKLFAPAPESETPSGRAYTIRHFREETCEMDIDFVLHGDGPCSSWAANAKPGDVVQIAGPRSGFRLDPEISHLLIGGDETALPAIGAILEALPEGIAADVFVEIPEDADAQIIRSRADVGMTWLPRNGKEIGTTTALAEAMMAVALPEESGEVWFAAEASVVRAVRRHFQVERGLDRRRITASGYWKLGHTDFRDDDGGL
ncbi:siderophore-interacting protein [Xanthobacter oligotrophicus]|uniref:siderophore-interacting protein n=1 Tax=Xanthobacter oligotrophicus TaxID=2607286 RepID=UPI00165DB4F4|nr:siderophore-interacting protein [Xanthobacter oligotrophicus]MCG5237962.1 siderophore-interacting protein [Xanthobacter oligotrophicus]